MYLEPPPPPWYPVDLAVYKQCAILMFFVILVSFYFWKWYSCFLSVPRVLSELHHILISFEYQPKSATCNFSRFRRRYFYQWNWNVPNVLLVWLCFVMFLMFYVSLSTLFCQNLKLRVKPQSLISISSFSSHHTGLEQYYSLKIGKKKHK